MPSHGELGRASSIELGSPAKMTQYSKTGRPIRKTNPKAAYGFVDSSIIEDVVEEPIDTPSEDEDGIMKRAPRKRKRSPSVTPPPLDPIIRDEDPDGPSDDEGGQFQRATENHDETAVLQFNIPLGFHGPLIVKLDRSMLAQTGAGGKTWDMQPRRTRQTLETPKEKAQRPSGGLTFSDLPPEIRNKIYRQLFVTGEPISIPRATNLRRSGQFLSTCKLVYREGCSVLYGENTIVLDRSRDRRGPFWEPDPKEIGYTDARRFLKVIGPENVAYLRDVHLVLEDACPSATPRLSHEERRYINDEHLIDILRILRDAKLREFQLTFFGRRALVRQDYKFLSYLDQVKADKVSSKLTRNHWGGYHPKISHTLWDDLQKSMTRKKKLYSSET